MKKRKPCMIPILEPKNLNTDLRKLAEKLEKELINITGEPPDSLKNPSLQNISYSQMRQQIEGKRDVQQNYIRDRL